MHLEVRNKELYKKSYLNKKAKWRTCK